MKKITFQCENCGTKDENPNYIGCAKCGNNSFQAIICEG